MNTDDLKFTCPPPTIKEMEDAMWYRDMIAAYKTEAIESLMIPLHMIEQGPFTITEQELQSQWNHLLKTPTPPTYADMNKKPVFKPCPLCRSADLKDEGFGILCRGCGLWLGEGTKTEELGGYVKVWNNRTPKEPRNDK